MRGFTPHEDWMKLHFMTQTPYSMGHHCLLFKQGNAENEISSEPGHSIYISMIVEKINSLLYSSKIQTRILICTCEDKFMNKSKSNNYFALHLDVTMLANNPGYMTHVAN